MYTEVEPSTAEPSEAAETSRSDWSSAGSGSGSSSSKRMEVPACFPSRETLSTHGLDQTDVKVDKVLEAFIRTMQRGADMGVLLDNGNVLDVEASFDSSLSRLSLRVQDIERDIMFEEIERVSGPEETAETADTERKHPSELCTTLVLSSSHFLTFCFETQRMREYFEVCFRTILASQRSSLPEVWSSPDPRVAG